MLDGGADLSVDGVEDGVLALAGVCLDVFVDGACAVVEGV